MQLNRNNNKEHFKCSLTQLRWRNYVDAYHARYVLV